MQPYHQAADKGIAAEATPWFEAARIGAANDDVPRHEIGVRFGVPWQRAGRRVAAASGGSNLMNRRRIG